MSQRSRMIVLALALAGLGFASASSWVHYRLMTEPGYVSPCDVSQTFNCSQAYLSSYGSVRGVPVALGGVFWFALVALLAAFAKPSSGRERSSAGGYIFVLATIGLTSVLYLGYASFVVLKTACLLCLGTYACVLGIFVTSGLASTMSMKQLPVRLGSDLRSLVAKPGRLAIVLLFISAAVAAVGWFPREQRVAAQTALPADYEKQFAEAWAKQPRIDLGIPAEGAKIVIVKFNDWLCPSCKAYQMAYQPLIDKYAKSNPGAIKVVVKDFPWSTGCNLTAIHGHESSCEAAAAVRMARDRNKGELMIDWLFTNQAKLVEANLTGTGTSAPMIKQKTSELLGSIDFEREFQAKLPAIRRDVSDANALQVRATPTYYVNGVKTTADQGGNLDPAVFDLALRIELAKAGGK